jgi:hypothetical protein
MERDSGPKERGRKVPRTKDESWRDLLGLMSVPKHPGVYVLGCFARHVTFYSQQVRALNLIDALCKTGSLTKGGSVGVVGAGLAGLTAASAALRRGLSVHLFQQNDDPRDYPGRMTLQKSSTQRWVDPFIYDWPHAPEGAEAEDPTGAGRETLAGLPVLDWPAASAAEVRERVMESFDKVVEAEERKPGGGRIHFHQSRVTEDALEHAGGRWLVTPGEDSGPVAVDVLVLAVGFGVEDSPPAKNRYWTDDGLGGDEADRKLYLISGAGDGGLTDVMRLCIDNFKHRTVLDKFKDADAIGRRLEAVVRERRPGLGEYFIQEAGKVEPSPEDEKKLLAARKNEVYLTGSPESVFGAGAKASILNRLIVAWLFRRGRFKLVDAKLRGFAPEGSKQKVEYGRWGEGDEADPSPAVWDVRGGILTRADGGGGGDDGAPPAYDEVIVRHGPGRAGADSRKVSPLEECFPTFWKESEASLKVWKEMPHWDDWTRRPVWAGADFDDQPPLDLPAGRGLTYLVAEHPGTNEFVQQAMDLVVSRLHENEPPESRPPLVALDLVEDFKNPQRFGRAVRALCRADVAVFDLTEKEQCPEAFVMLGIRSVVRRGVTIVTTRFQKPSSRPAPTKRPKPASSKRPRPDSEVYEPGKPDAPFAVPDLPFLLSDINFCGWGTLHTFVTRLRRVIEEGREREKRLGHIYRDLPAYEEVRHLGPDVEDYTVHSPEKVVLFLSTFDEDYRGGKGSWLRSHTGAENTGIFIIESPSPERTSLKLYGAIRRTQLCIVDWTGRRPNVFFELGVRLAVSPTPPISVIHKGEEWAEKFMKGGSVGGIFDLFRPLVYDNKGTVEEARKFRGEVEARRRVLRPKETAPSPEEVAAEWPLNDALLSPSFVYEQVKRSLPVEAEDWNTPVWKELRKSADLILGSEPIRFPTPILFGDDEDFKARAGRSGLDRLFAAWYFLVHKYDARERLEAGAAIDEDEEPWKSLLEIGNAILLLTQDKKPDADYARMRDEVKELWERIE